MLLFGNEFELHARRGGQLASETGGKLSDSVQFQFKFVETGFSICVSGYLSVQSSELINVKVACGGFCPRTRPVESLSLLPVFPRVFASIQP